MTVPPQLPRNSEAARLSRYRNTHGLDVRTVEDLAALAGRGAALDPLVVHRQDHPLADARRIHVVAALAGIAAAVLPARRASRLDVLEAVQYE